MPNKKVTKNNKKATPKFKTTVVAESVVKQDKTKKPVIVIPTKKGPPVVKSTLKKTTTPVKKTKTNTKKSLAKETINEIANLSKPVKELTVDTSIHEAAGFKIITKEQIQERDALRKTYVPPPEGPDPRGSFNPRGPTLEEARAAMNACHPVDRRNIQQHNNG